MQYAKDEIKQRIIDEARREFLEKGFEKASIRTITTKAKTSKSNLYNYFRDKDHLFYSVVEPVLIKIKKGLELSETLYVSKGTHPYTKETQKHVMGIVKEFISENLVDVKLLLFHTKGSSIENFRDEITNAFTDMMCNWVKSIQPDKEISRIFVKCISYFYLNCIELMILNGVSEEQVEKIQDELLGFVYNGWKGIFQS